MSLSSEATSAESSANSAVTQHLSICIAEHTLNKAFTTHSWKVCVSCSTNQALSAALSYPLIATFTTLSTDIGSYFSLTITELLRRLPRLMGSSTGDVPPAPRRPRSRPHYRRSVRMRTRVLIVQRQIPIG